MTERITPGEARRIALGAQGFGKKRPETVRRHHLTKNTGRLGVYQIDSVNVVSRAHYLPAFSRLGAYDRSMLDQMAWARNSRRRLFEYWGHAASLIPLEYFPLMRWRMARADRGEEGYGALRRIATEERQDAMAILDRIRDEGPLPSSAFESGNTGWWEWSKSKHYLEWLFYAGHVTTATRLENFERVYDLTERVIPAEHFDAPIPTEAEAHRALIEISARALGIASPGELRDYFRLGPAESKTAIAELVEAGTLIPVSVKNWPEAYLHRDATCPARPRTRALLAPFDPLVWERDRAERIFGFRYRIEIYVPEDKRQYGYYVLPFLLNGHLVARVDVKADRAASRLLVRSRHFEPRAPAETAEELGAELAHLAQWLGLDQVVMEC